MKHARITQALMLSLISLPVYAQLALHGWTGLQVVRADETLSHHQNAVGLRTHGELSWKSPSLQGLVALEQPWNDNLGDNTRRSLVREAWLRYSSDAFDLTVGRQYLPEGRSDWIRPQGQFAPRDYTQPVVITAEQRLSLPALRFDYYPSTEATLSLALVRQEQEDILPSKFSQLPNGAPLDYSGGWARLLRAEWRKDMWELGFSYFDGSGLRPAISLNGTLPISSAYRQRRIAVDGSLNLGGDILRWDLAYACNDADVYPGLPHREWIASVGWDQRVWSDTTFNTQVIYREAGLPNASSSPLVNSVELANRRLSQLYHDRQAWVTFSLRRQFGHQYELEAAYLRGLLRMEYAGFVRWSWMFADQWRFSIRGQFANGGADTLAGNIMPSKLVLGELRYQF